MPVKDVSGRGNFRRGSVRRGCVRRGTVRTPFKIPFDLKSSVVWSKRILLFLTPIAANSIFFAEEAGFL